MTNIEYVNALLSINDVIYIDTSSLMNVQELSKFLDSYQQCFIKHNKKIIVTREVCLEIVKHLSSKIESKQFKAQRVIDLFKEFRDVFIFEDQNLNNLDAEKAFADSELLSRLTKGKTEFSQLLITNDKKLSVDAYSLNNLNSCFGKKISVCYISKNGLLHKGETDFGNHVINENNGVELENSNEEQVVSQISEGFKSKLLYSVGGIVIGVVLTKYIPKLVRFI